MCTLYNLQALNLSHNQITDEGVIMLFSSPAFSKSLKELRMDHCKLITDEAIEIVLDNCKALEVFIIHSCPKTTNRSLHALEQFLSEQTSVKQVTFTAY